MVSSTFDRLTSADYQWDAFYDANKRSRSGIDDTGPAPGPPRLTDLEARQTDLLARPSCATCVLAEPGGGPTRTVVKTSRPRSASVFTACWPQLRPTSQSLRTKATPAFYKPLAACPVSPTDPNSPEVPGEVVDQALSAATPTIDPRPHPPPAGEEP
jgi:hypothetical protein